MNEKRLRAREEKEIDLIDLLIEIMLHWRGLIVAFLIGGILLGGYSFMQSYKAQKSAKAAAADAAEKAAAVEEEVLTGEERLVKLNEDAEELAKDLSATSRANIDTALSYYDQIEVIQDYLDTSVLMKADPYNIPYGDITFLITTTNDSAESIRLAYEKIMTSADMFNYIKDKCGYGSEVNELISVGGGETNNDLNNAVLRIDCYAATVDDCQKLVDTITEYVQKKAKELQTKLGIHAIELADSSVATGYNASIAQSKIDRETNILSKRLALAKLTDSFTDAEKEYYLNRKESGILSGQINDKIEEKKKAEEAVVIPGLAVSKKKILIGVVLGVFLYAGIICVAYIFSQKIKDSDDFTVTFGTAQLGKLYGQRSFKGFGKKLDTWLYSFKNRGRKAIDADEAAGIIAANTALSAAKSDIKKLGIICACGVDESAGGLVEKLKAAMKAENIDAKVLSQLLYSKDEAYSTKDLDAVVFVAAAGKSRYSEVWDAMEVVDNQKINILGGIMA
ncbi:MAG: hypothetical protein J5728_01365 [Lachnospiraceae bacterium]|nr:hypothetical protein [Lachnospiraceae bacterium]